MQLLESPPLYPLFTYGTLLDATFVGHLLERPVENEPARLLDHRVIELAGLSYPVILSASGETVEGRLYRDLQAEDFVRLDAYEGVREGLYQRATGQVVCEAAGAVADEAREETAHVYLPTDQTLRRYG